MQEHRSAENKKKRRIKHHDAMLMHFSFEEPLRPRTNPSSTQKRFSEGTRPRPEHSPQKEDNSGKLLDQRPAKPEWDSDAEAEPERSPRGARTKQRTPKGPRDSERTLGIRSEARAKPERSREPRKNHGTPKGRSGSRNYIIPRPQYLLLLLGDMSNPKPGHTTGGSGRGARRSGRAGSGRVGCQQKCSPRKQRSVVPSKASKKRRFNVSPEARTNEILCKPKKEQNQRLTRG